MTVVPAAISHARSVVSFALTQGSDRVKVCPIPGGSRVERIVEQQVRGTWVALPGVQVLVRPRAASGRFDEQTAEESGRGEHGAYTHVSGMRVNVSVAGDVDVGEGTL
ncbi:MAG: hypothetical protein R3F55_22090 [Alphaproteobacteria bacterium]